MPLDAPTLAVAAGLAASGSIYAAGARRLLARRRDRFLILRLASFALGWIVLVIALLSPLAVVSEWLFSAHMTQHTLLILVAAPLIAAGQPVATMMTAMPHRGASRLITGTRPIWRAASSPAVAFCLLLGALWIWHVPALHEAALHRPSIHLLQHVSFLAAASAFWWGLVHGRYGRQGYGLAVLFVFLTALHSTVLGALLTVTSRVLYPTYVARGAVHHVNALADQQLAGLIMWVPSGVIFIVVGLALFAAWLGEAERRVKLGGADAP